MAVLSWAAIAAAAVCYTSLVTAVASQLASPAGKDGTRSRTPAILEHPSSVYAIGGRPVTLRCRHWSEQGSGTEVSWYRDRARVATHLDDPRSYFYLDRSTGDLLILQFVPEYAGAYYCNVTNRYGSVVSSSATIGMAYIKEEFENSPKSVVAASGQDVRFACTPPLAMPRPQASWRTDSGSQGMRTLSEAGLAGRVVISTEDDGRLKLTVMNVSKADVGEYWCTAENEAGSRTSNRALLSVEEKPLFILSPEDTIAKVDGSVTLHCVARSGDTLAAISWIRDSGGGAREPINSTGRWSFLNDGNLNIQPVRADDEGRYTCLAHGNVTSSPGATGEAITQMSAYLTVDTPPYVLGRPVDRVATERGTVYFHCHADSSPPPRIIWQKANSTDFVFARSGHASGRLLVFDNGTLRISDVRLQDSGEYNCFVINRAGSSSAKANLSVQTGTGVDPPPVITSPPRNVVAEVGSPAFFSCSVDGRRPVVRWLKDSRPLLAGGRFTIVGAANLRIADVQVGDSGSYTCLAMSKSGDASASAQLSVTGLLNSTVQRGQRPVPPGKPRVTVFQDSAVLLSVPQQQQPVLAHADDWAYRAEGFSYSVPEGWVATQWVRSDGKNIVFAAVIPGAAYYFVVRTRSSQGYVSEPSLPSDVVQIPGPSGAAAGSSVSQQMQDGKDAASRMPAVALVGMPYAIGSTSLNVTWAIVPNNSIARLRTRQTAAAGASPYVEGFYVRTYSSRDSERRTDVVFSSLSTYHVVNNLEPYTSYRVSVAPFYAGETGASTKPADVVTGEDVPTGPPLDVRVVHIKASGSSSNASSFQVTWQPPERRHHRGNILGYVVLFTATAEPRSSQNATVLGAGSTAVELDALRPDVDYRVTVAAFTRAGLGVASRALLVARLPAADVGQPPVQSDAKRPVTEEPWFLPTVIGFIGLSTGAIILILVVCLCLRHRSGHPLCSKKGRFLAVPYEGARGDSATPDAYLTYRLEAMDRTPSSLPHHEQLMLTDEHVMRGGCDGELEFDEDDFRCQTPVPPYPPVPPPIAATSSSSSRGKLVEEHNLDSSGDSTPASSVAAADVQHRARGGGGRKGALYSKASVLESLGETAASTAAGGGSGLYATTCLYRLSQDSLLLAQSPRDSRQVATGQAPPSSSSSTAQHAELFNLRGGSESSCTDNNGRSSAGTGSEAALPPGSAGAVAAAADDCSCCAGDCCSLRRGQSPQLPQFVDMLPPPPHYPYYPVSPLAAESCASSGSSRRVAAPPTIGQACPAPTSVATLLRHVHPPPPPPLLHQHSAPQMGQGRGFRGHGGGGGCSGGGSSTCGHQHPGESAYAAANAPAAATYCPYCLNTDRRRTSGAPGMTAAAAATAAAAIAGQYPRPNSSRSDLTRVCQGSGSGKSDDSATLCSRRSTDSDSAAVALGETPSPQATHCRHPRACSAARGFGRSHYHSVANFDPHCCAPAAAASASLSSHRRADAAGGAELPHSPFCPHSAAASVATASVRCPGCYRPSGTAALPPSSLHSTVSYPSGFTVPAAGRHGLILAEETSSTAEYEEPWEDQPWLYNPAAWSGLAPRAVAGGVGERGQATGSSSSRRYHHAASAAAAASVTRTAAVVRVPDDGRAQLLPAGPHSDPDDEVAAAMACVQPPAVDKAVAEDSLDSSSSSSDEGESKLFANEGPVDQQQQLQSKAAKADGGLPSKRRATASKPAVARHSRRRTATQGAASGQRGGGGGGYSTDSSFVFVPLPRRPYPKSARRRQMQQQQQQHNHHQHHHYRRNARPAATHLQNSKLADGADDNDDEEEEEDAVDRV